MRRLMIALIALGTADAACTEAEEIVFGQVSEGGACSQVSDCKPGLDCTDDVCTKIPALSEPTKRGEACTATAQCGDGLCCGSQGVCRPVEQGFAGGMCGFGEGLACGFTADCAPGLVCTSEGVCGTAMSEGTGGLGTACESLSDCRRPLVCGLSNKCERLPFFAGVSCTRSEEEVGAFRMYFEVPRGAPLDEFFRQPFPSDVRRKDDGHPDLTGYPSPGEVLGIDFTNLYVRAIEQDNDGFALTAPIFAQWSDQLDPRTFIVNTATATVWLAALDTGTRVPLQRSIKADRGQLTCPNTVAVAPLDGVALRPNTTYALVFETGIKSKRGEAPIVDGDMRLVLAAATPSDPHVAKAHAEYEKLRSFLASKSIPIERIAGASVFTTGDPAAISAELAEVVNRGAAPAPHDFVRCDQGVAAPCASAMHRRGCLRPVATTHHELQGRVDVVTIQQGTRPYFEPGPNGTEGAIGYDAQGRIVAQAQREGLCVGLSVPKTAMPPGGWPLVIYGHGTGGDYQSGLDQLAGPLAAIGDGSGGVLARVAVLTFDNVMHGPRQGLPEAAWVDPGDVFFNLKNPRAARDNIFQGAADVLSLVRFARTATVNVAGVGDVRFDPTRIVYYGHSQGTVIVPPMFPAHSGLKGFVLTGAGAEIGLTVLEKKKPTDVSALVRTAFGDQGLSRLHPAIALLSTFYGPSDAPAYAGSVVSPEHAFLLIYGLRDGFTPESTQMALVRGSALPIVGPVLRPISGSTTVPTSPAPSSATAQFEPPSSGVTYDGHFVGSRDPAAKRLIELFIGTAATGARAEIRR